MKYTLILILLLINVGCSPKMNTRANLENNGHKLYYQKELNNYISSIVKYICKRNNIPNNIQIVIIDKYNHNPDLYARADNTIVMNKAFLVQSIQSEDVLAAYLAHEIAHITLNHHLKTYKKMRYTGIVSTFLNPFIPLVTAPEDEILKHYLHADEFEADIIALKYLKNTKYNPRAYLVALNTIKPTIGTYFAFNSQCSSSHPLIAERIKRCESCLPSLIAHINDTNRCKFISKIDGLKFINESRYKWINNERVLINRINFFLKQPKNYIINTRSDILEFVSRKQLFKNKSFTHFLRFEEIINNKNYIPCKKVFSSERYQEKFYNVNQWNSCLLGNRNLLLTTKIVDDKLKLNKKEIKEILQIIPYVFSSSRFLSNNEVSFYRHSSLRKYMYNGKNYPKTFQNQKVNLFDTIKFNSFNENKPTKGTCVKLILHGK